MTTRFSLDQSVGEIIQTADVMTGGKEYIPQIAIGYIAAKTALEQTEAAKCMAKTAQEQANAAKSMKKATWILCFATIMLAFITFIQILFR